MPNELRHEDTATGTTLKRTDWEDVDSHRFDSQATGDMLIATSATQLSRLGITNDRILVSSGGLFSWSNTLPAFTLDGTLNADGKNIMNIGYMSMGAAAATITFDCLLTFANQGAAFTFRTKNASDTARTRFNITGGYDVAEIQWQNITHTGFKLGDALTLDGYDLVADTSTGTKFATATNQKIAFYGTSPIVKQTGVGVSDAAIHAALVNLGLIAA